MMKESHPDWGVEKISALLLRGPALPASPQAVARVLDEAGYQAEQVPTQPHPGAAYLVGAAPQWFAGGPP
jgi:hypothetical protein